MNLQELLENLGIFTIGTVTVTTVIGFIAKSIFNNYLSKKVELYKSQLQYESETFKAELQRQNAEHQIKFSALHKDRATIIKELHTGFLNVRKELIEYNKDPQLQQLPKEQNPVLLRFYELRSFFNLNKLFFPKSL